MTDVAAAGQRAVAEARRLFALDVYDPSLADATPHGLASKAVISSIIKACGWDWELPYRGNGQVEWCVMFVGKSWREAGLDPKWLAAFFASTIRLSAWAHYRPWNQHDNHKPSSGELRLVAMLNQDSTSIPFTPQAGDILTIGDGTPPEGDHCTLVESYDPVTRMFSTIEGNGVGLGPDGKRREGIVRGQRKLGGAGYCARMLVRPGPSDLVALASPSS